MSLNFNSQGFFNDIDEGKFETAFPQFFDLNEMGRIHRELHCHIFTFNEKYTRFFDLLSEVGRETQKDL